MICSSRLFSPNVIDGMNNFLFVYPAVLNTHNKTINSKCLLHANESRIFVHKSWIICMCKE